MMDTNLSLSKKYEIFYLCTQLLVQISKHYLWAEIPKAFDLQAPSKRRNCTPYINLKSTKH